MYDIIAPLRRIATIENTIENLRYFIIDLANVCPITCRWFINKKCWDHNVRRACDALIVLKCKKERQTKLHHWVTRLAGSQVNSWFRFEPHRNTGEHSWLRIGQCPAPSDIMLRYGRKISIGKSNMTIQTRMSNNCVHYFHSFTIKSSNSLTVYRYKLYTWKY